MHTGSTFAGFIGIVVAASASSLLLVSVLV
jgi:hypothetical protein